MKIGDLVRHKEHHNYMGIVVERGVRDILVAWHDGDLSWGLQKPDGGDR